MQVIRDDSSFLITPAPDFGVIKGIKIKSISGDCYEMDIKAKQEKYLYPDSLTNKVIEDIKLKIGIG